MHSAMLCYFKRKGWTGTLQGAVQELESIVGRAMRQAAQSLGAAQVPEDVFWYAKQVSDANLLQLQVPLTV